MNLSKPNLEEQKLAFILLVGLVVAASGCTQQISNSNTDNQAKEMEFSAESVDYSVEDMAEVNRKLAVEGEKNGKDFIVYDGERYGESVHIQTPSVTEINGKLAYIGSPQGEVGNFLRVGDKKIDAEEGREIYNPVGIDGKIAYLSKPQSPTDTAPYIIYGGEKIGTEFNKNRDPMLKYAVVHKPVNINGKIAYRVENTDNKEFLVYDGKKSEKYNLIAFLQSIGGRITYLAETEDSSFIKWVDKKIGQNYDRISNVFELRGKPAFLTLKEGEIKIIHNGKEKNLEYGGLTSSTYTDIGGKLTYRAGEDNGFIAYGGQKVGEEYNIPLAEFDPNNIMVEINDKLVFTGIKNGTSYIVREN
jgi:hypothetical protein